MRDAQGSGRRRVSSNGRAIKKFLTLDGVAAAATRASARVRSTKGATVEGGGSREDQFPPSLLNPPPPAVTTTCNNTIRGSFHLHTRFFFVSCICGHFLNYEKIVCVGKSTPKCE